MKATIFTLLTGLAALAGCVEAPAPTPGQAAAFESDMQALAGTLSDDAVQVGNSYFEVVVSGDRRVALVRPLVGTVTIETIEAAAVQSTGCQARAVENLYDYSNGRRNVAISRRESQKYGSQLPVTLSC